MLEIDPKLVEEGRRLVAENRALEEEQQKLLRELHELPFEDWRRPEVQEAIRELSHVEPSVEVMLLAATQEMRAAREELPPIEELTSDERRQLAEAWYDLRDVLAEFDRTLEAARSQA